MGQPEAFRLSASRTALSAVAAGSIVSSTLTVQTSGAGFVDLTAEAKRFLQDVSAQEGLVTLFIRHTSASLTIQENADPSVLVDLTTALDRLAPEDAGWTMTPKALTTCPRTSRQC